MMGLPARIFAPCVSSFRLWNGEFWQRIFENRRGKLATIHASIDVSGACNLQFFEAFDRADCSNNVFGDLAWRLAQFPGQLECERESILTKLDFGGLLNGKRNPGEAVSVVQEFGHPPAEAIP